MSSGIIKKFFSDSMLFVFAIVFTKGIGLLMLPIYVSYLTKTELGMYDYIIAVGSFITVIVALEISQSVIRFGAESSHDKDIQRLYISHGFWFTIICYLVFLSVALLFLDEVSLFLTDSKDNLMLTLLALLAFFTAALSYLSNVIFRSQLKSKLAAYSSFLNASVVATTTILVFKFFDFGVYGVFASLIIGQSIVSTLCFYLIRDSLTFKFQPKILLEMLKFSSPLVVSSISVITLTMVDRIVIRHYMSYDDVAIYGVAAKFASVMVLITIGFQTALSPLIYANSKNEHLKKDLQKLFVLFVFCGVIVYLAINLLSEFAVALVAGKEYNESAALVPILSVSVLIHAGYIFFPGLVLSKRTVILAFINILSGILNLILNIFLIQKMGVLGAAYATLISSFVYFALNAMFSERYFPIFMNSYRKS
ncbi:hypothetical protein CWI82_03000 [Pseudidiomarina tainanensis]|uniref:Uncharacterized protein n=1 Tax=Pseudidiomarina tainanensis TaxID=502365 RepID=A0ACD2HJ74_9GAMM|nr:oligosaccharide flippase family protein [Pseudidiomarina tainanensis]RZQ56293.1 hypothetical protein CWI82_03000 [Pseudidiomarina tainanensis]